MIDPAVRRPRCTRSALLALLLGACGPGAAPSPMPAVTTLFADGIGPHGATLHGRVNANDTSGQLGFRFGGDPTLAIHYDRWPYLTIPGVGLAAPIHYSPDYRGLDYAIAVSGLVPGWTYRYCAVATEAGGAFTLGEIRSFTTTAEHEPSWFRVLAPGRADTAAPSLVALGDGFAVFGWSWTWLAYGVAFGDDGELRWQRCWNAPVETSPAPRAAGQGCLITLRWRLGPVPSPDFATALTRLDADGRVVWQREVQHWIGSGGATADGGAVATVRAPLEVARWTADGTLAWSAGSAATGEALSAFELADGSIAVVGKYAAYAGFYNTIPIDVRTADGQLAWRRLLFVAGSESAHAAEPVPAGGLVVAGSTWVGALQMPLLVRVARDGSLPWAVRLPGELGPATGVAVCADGGFLLAGVGTPTLGTTFGAYAWVCRFDAGGALLWSARYPGSFVGQARAVELTGGRVALAAAMEIGYQRFGMAVLCIGPDHRAGTVGESSALTAEPQALVAEDPLWADHALTLPASHAGEHPSVPIVVTALQVNPQQ